MKKTFSLFLAAVLLTTLCAYASPADSAKSYYTKNDASVSLSASVAAFSIGLARDGAKIPAYDASAVSGLSSAILGALSVNRDPYLLPGNLPSALVSKQAADGSFGTYISEHIYAMLALNAAPAKGYNAELAQEHLQSLQLADGGFAFFGDTGDVDVTAMALLVLTGESVNDAVNFIKSKATSNGGFINPYSGSTVENSCSVAAVISGFIATGEEVPVLWFNNLLSFMLNDGSFIYEAGDTEADESFSTPQAITALGDYNSGKSVYRRLPKFDMPVCNDWADTASWARNAINKVYELGIMTVNNNLFNPKNYFSKAELATVLSAIIDRKVDVPEINFSDVKKTDWYYTYIARAVALGIASPDSGSVFNPKRNVTREEVAHWIATAFNLEPAPDCKPADYNKVTPKYAAAVSSVIAEGIMIGDGVNFNPDKLITRQEMAVILAGLYG